MLRVFGTNDRIFETNGDVILKSLKARVHEADNGDYYLDLQTGIEYADYIKEGCIVVANTPGGDQAFRISNPEKTRTKISAKAWHVFYDARNMMIADVDVENKKCGVALAQINAATDVLSPFATSSDVQTAGSLHIIRQSLYEAVQRVLETYGGHIVRDNYSFAVVENIGQDRGVEVRYAKNLKEITCVEKWDDVVTKLLPVGKDGIMLNALDERADIYVYAPRQYDIPYTRSVTFSQSLNRDDYPDDLSYQRALVEDLSRQAQEYVASHSLPSVNYSLRANVEVGGIGDVIHVIDKRLGVNMLTRVISYEYDCQLSRFIELEFGDFQPTLSGLVGNITSSVDKTMGKALTAVSDSLTQDIKTQTGAIWGTLEGSYVIFEGSRLYVVDALPKTAAQYVIMVDSAGVSISDSGINGTYRTVWSIDGTLDLSQVDVTGLIADMIVGGVLRIGSDTALEVRGGDNELIARMDERGLDIYGRDGSYLVLNRQDGIVGYDRLGEKTFWVTNGEFHQRKNVAEEEITICNRVRFLQIMAGDHNGVGLVSLGG